MKSKPTLTTGNNNWGTPQRLFDNLNETFNFTIDVCADKNNYKMIPYFTVEDNAIIKNWNGSVWCNPPYSADQQGKFIDKALYEIEHNHECRSIVMLIPARTDTKNFEKLYNSSHTQLVFIKGRISFEQERKEIGGATFGSMLVIFKKENICNFKTRLIDRKELMK